MCISIVFVFVLGKYSNTSLCQHATSTLTATANLTQKYTTADTEFNTVYRNIQYTEYDTKQFAKMLFKAETFELSLSSCNLSFEF